MRDRNALNTQLQKYFGFDRFKGQQEEVIDSILDRNDTFVLMPTGAGRYSNCNFPSYSADEKSG
jgi:ATP-dependent DNA helicase RecQ